MCIVTAPSFVVHLPAKRSFLPRRPLSIHDGLATHANLCKPRGRVRRRAVAAYGMAYVADKKASDML